VNTRYTKAGVLLITMFCLWQTRQLFAGPLLGVDATSGSNGLVSGNGGLTLGWQFQVSNPNGISVNGLGFWDYQSDGFFLDQTFDVGLWNSSTGNLLAESVITSSSTLVPSLDTAGGWRVNSISSLTLTTGGLYTIGALMPVTGANQIVSDPGTYQAAPGINFEDFDRQIGSSTLAMPNIGPPYSGAIWLGPTFTFGAVPEPSSISLLLAGLALPGMFRRFQRKNKIGT